jgi:hypothetical protein
MNKTIMIFNVMLIAALFGCATQPDADGNRTVFVRNTTDLDLTFTYNQGFAGATKLISEPIRAHSSNPCQMKDGINVEYNGVHHLMPEGCATGSCKIIIDSVSIGILN